MCNNDDKQLTNKNHAVSQKIIKKKINYNKDKSQKKMK